MTISSLSRTSISKNTNEIDFTYNLPFSKETMKVIILIYLNVNKLHRNIMDGFNRLAYRSSLYFL